MITKAIEKVRSEMAQNTANSYIQVVGGFLLQHLESNTQDAEKILVDDKTIGKSLEEIRKEASKKKVGNCAMFTPQEGFEIVMKYFGIKAVAPVTAPAVPDAAHNEPPAAPQAKAAPIDDFDIKLEDLLS